MPTGCSLLSMEPLRERFCRGADVTSPAEFAEFEAAISQMETYPPSIKDVNANIREGRWTNFSLKGVRFPTATIDVVRRGEALANFERDLVIHFQRISKAAALYTKALAGGVRRALDIYRRVDIVTNKQESSRSIAQSVERPTPKRHALV